MCVATVPFLFQSDVFSEVRIPAFSATDLWPATWPLLLGCLLSGFALMFSLRNRWSLPKGDILYLYLKAIQRLNSVMPTSLKACLSREQSVALLIFKPRAFVQQFGAQLGMGEKKLGLWTTFGAIFLILVILLIRVLLPE